MTIFERVLEAAQTRRQIPREERVFEDVARLQRYENVRAAVARVRDNDRITGVACARKERDFA